MAVVLTLVHRMQRTVIYIRKNNTDHRTHKTESKTYKAIKNKTENSILNQLKHNKGLSTYEAHQWMKDMCLNETYSRDWLGKYLSDMFPLRKV